MRGLRKKVIVILLVAVLVVIIMQLVECSGAARSASPDFERAPEETYEMVIENELAFVCPINCEDGKTYEEVGNCPVCDLPLKASNEEDINQSKISELDSIRPAKDETDNGSTDRN